MPDLLTSATVELHYRIDQWPESAERLAKLLLVVPSGREAEHRRDARMPSHLAVPPDALDLLFGRGKEREELARNAPEKGDDL